MITNHFIITHCKKGTGYMTVRKLILREKKGGDFPDVPEADDQLTQFALYRMNEWDAAASLVPSNHVKYENQQ